MDNEPGEQDLRGSGPESADDGERDGFLPADNVTATYSRVAGETVLGGPYAITATLSPGGVLDNYVITNAGRELHDQRAAGDLDDESGEQDLWGPGPESADDGERHGFLVADNVTATYSRATGETVLGGPYDITATLAPAAVLNNYVITNAGRELHDRPAAGDVDDEPGEQDVWGPGPESADDGERHLPGGGQGDGDL